MKNVPVGPMIFGSIRNGAIPESSKVTIIYQKIMTEMATSIVVSAAYRNTKGPIVLPATNMKPRTNAMTAELNSYMLQIAIALQITIKVR